MDKNFLQKSLFLALLTALLFVADLFLGSVRIAPGELLSILVGSPGTDPILKNIVWDFRVTKALSCLLAGGALSLSGLQMQTLFRNALAGPDVLGLTSGASLAVSIVLLGGGFSVTGPWGVAFASSVGCLGVFLIVLVISQRIRDNVSLLIIGLMIGAGTSSVVSVLQYASKAEELQTFIIWTFGSLGGMNWQEIQVLAIILLVGIIITWRSAKSLNAWLLGDHYAQSIGINLKRSRLIIIAATCIMTGAVTAFCGPITFVGLAVPHLTRMLIKTQDHKVLLPAVTMTGASLMLGCDILAQLPGSAQVLPINAITALIGAPVVIWVILRNKTMNV